MWPIYALVLAVLLCLTPNLAQAECGYQTIIINGKIITCWVCYDSLGRPTNTVCN